MNSRHGSFLGQIALSAALLVPSVASASPPANATALEARLYAPCCYGGTLDMHESELAHTLRAEIEERISRGESPDAIQGDFVARYGNKVVASKSDTPAKTMGLVVMGMMALVGIGVGVGLHRNRASVRLREASERRPPRAPVSDAMNARLDAELLDMDG